MSTAPQSVYVLNDIEARQDAVIRQLEELEQRIAGVLAEYGVSVAQPQPGRTAFRVVSEDDAGEAENR